ncbi:MAG: lysine--tRNA ligase [Candidatus Paceibacterota bacterium]
MASIEEIRSERIKKLEALRAEGINPYPNTANDTHSIKEALSQFVELQEKKEVVTLVGRVLSLRTHGALTFADIFDGTGKIQVYLKQDEMDASIYEAFGTYIDTSDFIEVTGVLFVTKRGQQSIELKSFRLLAKSLRPMPTEWFGIKDEDERYRKRYIDILLQEHLALQVRRRSVFWNTMRDFLLKRDFIEVETPVLENKTGGAEARPFITHHNALDIDLFLRISAGELWQKKLMVAGLPKTFEIGRIFRNEGMSYEHLQDYTQIEFYQAYSDFREGMKMVKELYREVAQKTFGTLEFTIGDFSIDLGAEWVEYDFCSLLKDAYGIDPREVSLEEVRAKLVEIKHKDAGDPALSLPRGVDALWKVLRKSIGGPGFLINVPVYLEPLAKKSETDARVVERFQIILAGSEMGKGFSELNDPLDQQERFLHQESLRNAGDDEAQMNDTDYVEALEYGMPPTFGFGISERLFSFLSNTSVREAQIFPLMRPRNEEEKEN